MEKKNDVWKKVFIAVALVALIGSGTMFAYAENDGTPVNQSANSVNSGTISDPDVQDIVKLKSEMGIDLENVSPIKGISKEEAIAAANNEVGSIKNKATKVVVTFHRMTYKNFTLFSEDVLNANPELKAKGHMDMLPVWIVSYKGLKLQPKGGLFQNTSIKPRPNTEFNVVVDAYSGKPLVSYEYR